MARHIEGPWFRESKNTWYVTKDGKPVSLRVKGSTNRTAAVGAWHRLMALPHQPPNESPPVPPMQAERLAAPRTAVIVQDVVDAFLADAKTRCKPESMSVYRSALNRLAKRFGDRPADGLRPHEAEAFANRKEWSASTQNTFLSAIVTAFRWSVRAGLLATNPLHGLRKPPMGSRGAKAVLTTEQFDRLHAAAGVAFKPYLLGLWLTGCRPGELASMTAGHVDFENGIATLTEHKTSRKTGKSRLVFLSPEAIKLFTAQAVVGGAGPLFPNKWGRAFNRFTIQKAMEAARTKAGLPHAIAYGMRHSFATAALVNGVPDATVAALLGHCGTAMLHRHYAHLTAQTQAMRDAVAKVRR